MESKSKRKPNRIKKSLKISLSESDKNYITEKANRMGFKTISAFLLESSKMYFKIDVDMSAYYQLSKEINYIGKNINSFVRQVFTDGIYTATDLEILENNQKRIIEMMSNEFSRLSKLEAMELNDFGDKKSLVKLMTQNNVKIPKSFIFDNVLEVLRNNFLFIIEKMEESPDDFKELSDYTLEFLYGLNISETNYNLIVLLSDEIFDFTEKMKFKFMKKGSNFDESDWFKLRKIIDNFEGGM